MTYLSHLQRSGIQRLEKLSHGGRVYMRGLDAEVGWRKSIFRGPKGLTDDTLETVES